MQLFLLLLLELKTWISVQDSHRVFIYLVSLTQILSSHIILIDFDALEDSDIPCATSSANSVKEFIQTMQGHQIVASSVDSSSKDGRSVLAPELQNSHLIEGHTLSFFYLFSSHTSQ